MRIRRTVLFRLLALAIALVVTLLVGEMAMRWLPAMGARHEAAPVSEKWWSMSYGHWRTRLPTVRLKPAGTFRVVTLGDSFTWGDEVYAEDTYAVRLVRRLAAQFPEVEFDLVNWSSPGWNTYKEVWTFKRELEQLDPDLVVLGYVLNDPEPMDEDELAQLREGLALTRVGSKADTIAGSRLLGRLRTNVRNLRSRQLLTRYYQSLYEYEPGWSVVTRSFRSLALMSQKELFPVLMVIFPIFDSQLDERYPYRDLHEVARMAGEEARLPVLDLLPFYEGIDAHRLAVVPFTDPHPNELGHRIAADAIADYLIAQSVVEGALERPASLHEMLDSFFQSETPDLREKLGRFIETHDAGGRIGLPGDAQALGIGFHFDRWTRGARPGIVVVSNSLPSNADLMLRLTSLAPPDAYPLDVLIDDGIEQRRYTFKRRGKIEVRFGELTPGERRLLTIESAKSWVSPGDGRVLGVNLQAVELLPAQP